jgi:hypothetical protein
VNRKVPQVQESYARSSWARGASSDTRGGCAPQLRNSVVNLRRADARLAGQFSTPTPNALPGILEVRAAFGVRVGGLIHYSSVLAHYPLGTRPLLANGDPPVWVILAAMSEAMNLETEVEPPRHEDTHMSPVTRHPSRNFSHPSTAFFFRSSSVIFGHRRCPFRPENRSTICFWSDFGPIPSRPVAPTCQAEVRRRRKPQQGGPAAPKPRRNRTRPAEALAKADPGRAPKYGKKSAESCQKVTRKVSSPEMR